MSIPFHLGHSSHSLIKAFVNTTRAIRTAWLERTTRSTMRREKVEQVYDESGTASTMSSVKRFTIPQRSSSRAPSLADMDFPASDSTVRDDEDTDMHGDDQARDGEEVMQSFGQRSRKLIKVIQKLENLGIAAELSLPKFVVVGDQSHGKSSIIEAICGISLPRSSGTCTRCPFRVTTTATRPGEDWSCKIALSRRYVCDRYGKSWKDSGDAEPVYFTTVTDRADLGHVLQLAQVAILNPTLDPATLLQTGAGASSTARSLSFSYNPIELRISGNELPELCMLDLPGSINVAPNENEQHLVGLIERLIKAYVKDEKALILLVASMDQDLETSTAFRVVGHCKALGRSMGVLTKADLFSNTMSRVEQSRQTLAGEKFRLGNSWFVTKNSSQEALDRAVTHLEARKLEEEFFRGVPWSSTLLDYEDRFGTWNLQNALSHRLVEHIESELPDIVARVNARLSIVTDKLDHIPERPSNPSHTVIEEVQKLVSTVVPYLLGDDDSAAFRIAFKDLIRGYRGQLRDGQPHVVLRTPGYDKPSILLDSDDEAVSEAPTPSKRQKTNSGQPTSSTPSRSTGRGAPQEQSKSDERVARAEFTLDEIHLALDQARSSDMQDQVHPKVIKRFVRLSIKSWPAFTAELLESVQKLVGGMLTDCIEQSLAQRSETALVGKVSEAVSAIYNDIHAGEVSHIDHLIRCEMHEPITYAPLKTAEKRTQLQEIRTAERVDEYYDTLEAEKHAKVPIGQKRKDMTKDPNFVTKTLGVDEYATEVAAMATPLAYYDSAAARIVDTIANHLNFGVLHGLKEKLQGQLLLALQVTDQGYCAELLAEDPAREAERQHLIAEREKLLKAVEELESLPGQH